MERSPLSKIGCIFDSTQQIGDFRLSLKVMRPPLVATLLVTVVSQLATAQPPDEFEVASVKPSAPGTRFTSKLDTAQFNCTGNSLLILILSTYPDVSASRVSGGPGWFTTDYWDVAAKLPPKMPTGEKELNRRTELMLEKLLADRFRLVIHREMRDQPTYALVVAKGRSKLKLSSASQLSVKSGRGRLEFQHQSMEGLTKYLHSPYITAGADSQTVDRPVIDMTGLQGFFDFTLEWSPETSETDSSATGPSVFTALEQQLGLKLQAQKSPAEFLVIDHAEKPSEN